MKHGWFISNVIENKKGATTCAALFRERLPPRDGNDSRNSAGNPLRITLIRIAITRSVDEPLTRGFIIKTLDLVEGWEFRTRVEMIIFVVIVDEPRPAQFTQP